MDTQVRGTINLMFKVRTTLRSHSDQRITTVSANISAIAMGSNAL